MLTEIIANLKRTIDKLKEEHFLAQTTSYTQIKQYLKQSLALSFKQLAQSPARMIKAKEDYTTPL
jgi:hypothetical protein